MDINIISRHVFAQITLIELHYWHHPNEAVREVINAVHDSKRNAVNMGIKEESNVEAR